MTSLDHLQDPVDEFLAFYPLPIALLAQRLSALVKRADLTFAATDHVTPRIVVDFTRDAARIASMSRGERELLAAARRAPASGR